VRQAHAAVQSANTLLLASVRRDLGYIERLRAAQEVASALQRSGEAEDHLARVMGWDAASLRSGEDYGPLSDVIEHDDAVEPIIGFTACWSEGDPDLEPGRHCRKPKDHEGDCARF
jgi:hypothetical protein